MVNAYDIIKYPLTTEKAVRLIESENTMVFVVSYSATKKLIEQSFNKLFNVKVTKIRVANDAKGRKKAYVTLDEKNPAMDIATKLGMM